MVTLQGTNIKYTGTGIGIWLRVFLGTILTALTLGLYFPWYLNGLMRYASQHVEVNGRPEAVRFTGSGASLFLRFLIWEILLFVTLGLYWPWVVNGIFRYVAENIQPSGGRLN